MIDVDHSSSGWRCAPGIASCQRSEVSVSGFLTSELNSASGKVLCQRFANEGFYMCCKKSKCKMVKLVVAGYTLVSFDVSN